MGSRRAIPDRWLDYLPVGKRIKGTRFIAFKCPLPEKVVESVPTDKRLSCASLLKKIPNLGMVIDLTFTTRYYNPNEFKMLGVDYHKLAIPGKEIPAKCYVNKFASIVKKFLHDNFANDKLVGVHCTHGVNRTGYLIAKYMISEMKMSPEEAMHSVGEARGHPIERENYRNSLTQMPGQQNQPQVSSSNHTANIDTTNNEKRRSVSFKQTNSSLFDGIRRHERQNYTPRNVNSSIPTTEQLQDNEYSEMVADDRLAVMWRRPYNRSIPQKFSWKNVKNANDNSRH